MSNTIDQKTVQMQFDNGQFNSGIQGSLSFIDKLKQSLNFGGSAKSFEGISAAANGVNMSGLSNGIEQVRLKFSALEVAAVTAIANITNAVVNSAKNMVSNFTIKPITDGFHEYETEMGSIQTIMANTASKGTTMSQVTDTLGTLNNYADKTIYSFQEMAKNIGTFTAAGVGLAPAAAAIQGIGNLAATSGSNSQQAATAMYQLSQALAAGSVKLMDWNSVVNAGMGGELFQKALTDTARRQGISVDEMIAKNGTFRESLQEGWLTADVLNETLNNFTVDGAKNFTDAQLAAGKMTQSEADAMNAQAAMMEDAATKVKTFSQLMDTLGEAMSSGWAKTWKILIGDFEEAKKLFTQVSNVIGGMITSAAEGRNKLLETWSALGGRSDVLEVIQHAFEGLMIIVNAVGGAFREIFPPITAKHLFDFTLKLRDLSEKFKMSDENAAKLKQVFAGMFAVIDMGIQIFQRFLGAVSPVTAIISGLAQIILNVAASIGNWLVGLDQSMKGMDKVGNSANDMKTQITDAFKGASDAITKSPLITILSTIGDYLLGLGKAIGTGLQTMLGSMIGALGTVNFSSVVGALGVAGFGAIVAGIIKFVRGLKAPFEGFVSVVEGVADILDQVKDSLKAYQDQIKAKALLTIAIAVGILALSLFLLSGIDGPKLAASLGALTIMFAELMAGLALFGKIDPLAAGMVKSSVVLITLSVAILILATAMKTLGELSWEQIAKGLTGVTVLMVELVAAMKLLSANEGSIVKGAGSLIILSIALKIMASALIDLSTLSWGQLAIGLVGLGVMLGAIALFCNNTKFTGNMLAAGAGILLISVGLKVMASAIKDLSTLSWEQLLTGLAGLGGSLLIMSAGLRLMPKNMLAIGAGLLVAAVGVRILASAVTSLGGMSWEQVAIGLVAMAGALLILAGGLYLMTGTLAGSAALLVASVAIGILTPSLMLLSSMSWDGIIKGLVTLAGTFLVFGLAAAILTPVIPAMLLLGVAVTLMGVGIAGLGAGLFLAGIGLQSLAVGFGLLAGMTAAGAQAVVSALTTIITGIVTLIPTVAAALGTGLIAFAQVITAGAPVLAASFIAICTAILQVIGTLIPQVVTLFFNLLLAIVSAFSSYIPVMAQCVMDLVLGILNVIATNIPLIIQAGVDIIIAFIMGVAMAIPQLVNAAFEAIIAFVNGLADAIRNNTGAMIDATNNLFDAMTSAGYQILQNSVGRFLSGGWALIQGVASGIGNGVGGVIGAVQGAIYGAIGAAQGAVSGFFSLGADMIRGMVNGIVGSVGGVISAAANAAKSALEAAKNAVLGHSPAVRFIWLGEDCNAGFAIGFIKSASIVADAAKKSAVGALDVVTNTVSKLGGAIMDGIDSQPVIRPVMDLSGIQNGVNSVNGLLNNQSVTLATSAKMTTQNSQQSVLDIIDDVVSATVNSIFGAMQADGATEDTNVTIEVPVYLDGREIAKATAPYSRTEINKLNKLQAKLGGVI